jgi:histidyl-tRNA synthetase
VGHLDLLAGIRERSAQLASNANDRLAFDELRIDRKHLAELQERTGYEGEHSIAEHADVDAAELARRLPLEAEATLRNVWAVEDLVPEARAETLIKISRLRGTLEDVLDQAKEALAGTPATEALENLAEVCRLVKLYGIDRYEIVMGIARGLTFYTGVVFEFTANGQAYGGGGRYDGLAEVFGAEPTPSVGCAFRFDSLLEALHGAPAPAAYELYLVSDADSLPSAIMLAEGLRDHNMRVGVGTSPPAGALVEATAHVSKNGVEIGDFQVPANADAVLAELRK